MRCFWRSSQSPCTSFYSACHYSPASPFSIFCLFVELYFVFLLNKTPHECGGSRLASGSIVPLIGRRSPELIMRSRLNNKPGSFSLASMLFISGEYVTGAGKGRGLEYSSSVFVCTADECVFILTALFRLDIYLVLINKKAHRLRA